MKYIRAEHLDKKDVYEVIITVNNKDADTEKTTLITPKQMNTCFFDPSDPAEGNEFRAHRLLLIIKSAIGKHVHEVEGLDDAHHELIPRSAWDHDGMDEVESIDLFYYNAKGEVFEVEI